MLAIDPATGAHKELLREDDDAWINVNAGAPRWLDDGSGFLWMTEKSGATDVGGYFNNYARLAGMRLEPGVVDGRPAILARESPDGPPVYCLFVRFRGEQIRFIRDYRYARYVFDEAQWSAATGAR